MLEIVSKRYWFFGLSLLVIVPGLIGLAMWGLPLAIDFTGGSLLEVHFESGVAPQPAEVVSLYNEFGVGDALVQSAGTSDIAVRSKPIDEATKNRLLQATQTPMGRQGGGLTISL